MMIGAAPEPLDEALRRKAQLRAIGVTEEQLNAALDEGDAAASLCGPNHPPIAAGIYRFAETVRSLADQLAPAGWTRRDYKNFSTIVRPDRRVAIAVASGDEGTGDLECDVTTRFQKGSVTAEVVNANLSLPLDESYAKDNEEPAVQTVTYFLLHARAKGERVAELSLPQTFAGGYVQKWSDRIPIRRGPELSMPLDLGGGDLPVNPNVTVKRKSAT